MVRTAKLLPAAFLLLLFPLLLHAQNYMNVLNVRYYLQPNVALRDTGTGLSFSEYRIEAAIPITLSNGSVLGIKPQYKSIRLTTTDTSLRNLQIYSVKAPLFAFIKWGKTPWSTYVDISPKLNSDLRNIDLRHFQVGAMVVNYYEWKKDFFWQFGLFYNQDTYGPFFMPLAGIDWKIDEKNYVAALLPAYVIYERRLGQRVYAGVELELFGETYRHGRSNYEHSIISQLGDDKMTFLTEPRLFVDYYFAPHWVVYLKPGVRLFLKYEHYTEADEPIGDSEYPEGILTNGFYMELGLAMRFRYDEEE